MEKNIKEQLIQIAFAGFALALITLAAYAYTENMHYYVYLGILDVIDLRLFGQFLGIGAMLSVIPILIAGFGRLAAHNMPTKTDVRKAAYEGAMEALEDHDES